MRGHSLALLSVLILTGCRQVSGLDEALPSDARPSETPKPKLELSAYQDPALHFTVCYLFNLKLDESIVDKDPVSLMNGIC